ncbi:phenylalanine--tRNA ligase subunit beta [Cellulomonas sp. KRMCY2]|uniref:phenylalanine--tRNA ligase subunit beta n=1 Tax=Cellulomonas sp. KRMCY2 TaxID=1304865 RepID=UPI00045E5C54|nr:phenylalanine--tRNA ligase subunit beta [Cellulomonas sp. KRMCY2]
MPRIPLTWLADHVELPAGTTAEHLAADLVRVGLEEEAIHPAAVTGPLVIGQVVECTPEEQTNGKTINWCRVDVGPLNEVTPDGSSRPRGIVCGAHNFGVGDRVVVALPGAVLPGPFPIASRKTYGHVSDGMICSARELGLGEDHDGIIVISRLGLDAEPGTDARALLGLGDEVLEINVTPDRGYCFSMRGVAREYGHSTGAVFTDRGLPGLDPDGADVRPAGGGFGVELADDAPIDGRAGCDRFVAQVVRGVAASGPSPVWMQRRLTQAGMRPISLAVDVTNYVMLDLGQPLHAYDLGQVVEPIVVRRARPQDRLRTLDGVDRRLLEQDLLITDSPASPAGPDGRDGVVGSRVLGLAGVMGGAESEITTVTTDLLIEAAHFDPVSVARTARRHKLPSEAARRFERGVDPQLPRVAVARVVALLLEHGGGQADSAVTDVDRTAQPAVVSLPVELPARLVGVDYSAAQVRETLEEIGCQVSGPPDAGVVDVSVPSWRPDLTRPVDLVEEIARLRGYDAIPSVLPTAPAGRGLTDGQRARRSVAWALAGAGFVEVLTYPFVGAHQHDELALPADDVRRRAVRLLNPLSDEQPEMRTNLLVTLLDAARRNVARGTTDLAVFEIGLVTRPVDGAPAAPRLPGAVRPSEQDLARLAAAVPPQPRRVAGVLTGVREPAGWWGPGRRADHTDAIAAALLVARTVRADVVVARDADHAPWHPGRTARLQTADGTLVGHAGELHPKVVAALALPARAVAFEVDLDVLLAAAPSEPLQARPVSGFPVAKEDIALVVDAGVSAGELLEAVRVGASASAAGDIVEELRLFDVYTGSQVGAGKKSLAFSLRLRAGDRTLTAAEAADVRECAVAEANRRFGAVLRA